MKTLSFIIIISFFFGCQTHTNELPILSYKINSEGKKEDYTITYSNFTNQDGKPLTTATLEDKVVLANFFFTRCPSICPPMRMQLIAIANTFLDDKNFILISHTIDPNHDTITVLKDYADNTGIPSNKWLFVKASQSNTKLQANQFMTNFRPNEDGTDFYHSSYVALLDKNQMIRGFYNILIPEDVDRLIADARTLLKQQ